MLSPRRHWHSNLQLREGRAQLGRHVTGFLRDFMATWLMILVGNPMEMLWKSYESELHTPRTIRND